MDAVTIDGLAWRLCDGADAEQLGRWNAQLSVDEGGEPVGDLPTYTDRMARWLDGGRYAAALAEGPDGPVGYVLWRDDEDYGDVYLRQFFVAREHRGRGIGRQLFEEAVAQLWHGRPLRLDVYDSNPRGLAFWGSVGFEPYSRLMRRAPQAPPVTASGVAQRRRPASGEKR